jgi:hypothetical protein
MKTPIMSLMLQHGENQRWHTTKRRLTMAKGVKINMTEKKVKTSEPEKALKGKAGNARLSARVMEKPAARNTPVPKSPGKPARKTATFTLDAPQATQVFVAGCFNDWNPVATPLQRDQAGTWKCAVRLEPGEHEYRFVVDGAWWDDPVNILRRGNEFGTQNSILIVED